MTAAPLFNAVSTARDRLRMARLLVAIAAWIDKVQDYGAGADYLNGDSDKYPGDGWKDLAALRKEIDWTLAKRIVAENDKAPAKVRR